ncbi:MAG: hypothetical protein AB2693_33555 [Candidatus Thiodiazotropha sp.]
MLHKIKDPGLNSRDGRGRVIDLTEIDAQARAQVLVAEGEE